MSTHNRYVYPGLKIIAAMNKDQSRFSDAGDTLADFADHFVVHCPKCNAKAHINADKRLTCPACFHVEEAGHWYGAATAAVQVKCRDCHNQLFRSAPWDGQWKKLALHCDQCGDSCEYEASITRHYFDKGRKTDPVFGLPLWLQDDFRGELFWVYNYEHLETLRAYIAAKLRERGIDPRNTIRKNTAMVSRLPDFIKKAKNRENLLKLIEAFTKK